MKRVLAFIISGCFITSMQGMGGERVKEDLYKVLGIEESATLKEIKKAYYKLARTYHPDKHLDEKKKAECSKKMKLINTAYAVLKDPDKRKKYDATSFFDFIIEDMADDIMGGFGVDTYDEEKDEDFVTNMSEVSCGSSDEESFDSENDSFDEGLYEREGAHLKAKWKSFYHNKSSADEDDKRNLLTSSYKTRRSKRLRKIVEGHQVDTW